MKIKVPALLVKKTEKIIAAPSKALAHDQLEAKDHIKKGKVKEGFLTTAGKFVGRKKAEKIAEGAKQVPKHGGKLHSTDLRRAAHIKKKVIK